jgi:Kdo2-lipid IVA lauroyltransferase/acyltransferase
MSPPPELNRRDLREGGRWSAPQRLKNGLIYRTVCILLAVADRLPSRVLLGTGRKLGSLAYRILPALRSRARRELARVFTRSQASELARSTFVRAGENLAACLLLRRAGVRALDLVEVPRASREILGAALAEGRGVVFVSPHHGPFELVAAAVAELGHRPAVVVRESYDPRLDAVVDRHRLLRGLEVIHRGKASAPRTILRALRAGRIVGFLPDLAGRVSSVPARFLGADRPFAVGPQRIACRKRAPLLMGTLRRTERGFLLDITRAHASAAADMTRCVVSHFETAISASPADWPWMAARSCERVA